MESRMEDLRCLYVETVTVADAARIIGMSRNSMYALLRRGKISRACGGKRIDVRSVARYIDEPAVTNHRVRVEKGSVKRV